MFVLFAHVVVVRIRSVHDVAVVGGVVVVVVVCVDGGMSNGIVGDFVLGDNVCTTAGVVDVGVVIDVVVGAVCVLSMIPLMLSLAMIVLLLSELVVLLLFI